MRIKTILALSAAVASLSACAHRASESLTPQSSLGKIHTVESIYSFEESIGRLQQAVADKGMTVFTLIDHQDAARQHGLQMQPATVIIFGNPKVGTPLMIKDPAFALQLPLRVLVTEIDGKTHVIFNDTRALIDGSRIARDDVEHSLANAEKLIRATVTQ